MDTPPTLNGNAQYMCGVQHHGGHMLMAALMHRYPRYSKHGGGTLPRFHLCLRGWKLSIAAKQKLAGRRRTGALLLVMLCSYAPPSKLLPLRTRQLVPPTSSVTNLWSLLIAPREDGQFSKTNLTDVSILLDWKWCHWMENDVSILHTEDNEARVFPFSNTTSSGQIFVSNPSTFKTSLCTKLDILAPASIEP